MYPIDTPVMVRNSIDEDWVPRHFAGMSKTGKFRTIPKGKTSWTYQREPLVRWRFCREPFRNEWMNRRKK